MITAYTDGSCLGNPGPGGWCSHFIYNERHRKLRGRKGDTTNNIMEMTAVLRTLEYAVDHGIKQVNIWTDSTYTINGYLGKTKQHKNLDLWEMIFKIRDSKRVNVNIRWVGAHADTKKRGQVLTTEEKGNIFADDIANKQAKKILLRFA